MKQLVVGAILALSLLPGSAMAMTSEKAESLARWAGLPKDVPFSIEVLEGIVCPTMYGGGNRTPGPLPRFPRAGRYGQVCYDSGNEFNGWFATGEFNEFPEVHIIAGKNVSDEIITEVIFHEVGHYKQWIYTNHDIDSLGSPYLEWDADKIALDSLCAYYHNSDRAVEIVHSAWQWLKLKFGYTGDPRHGTTYERMEFAVAHAEGCKPRHESL